MQFRIPTYKNPHAEAWAYNVCKKMSTCYELYTSTKEQRR